jgi:Xaa-Pro aminopeptidase
MNLEATPHNLATRHLPIDVQLFISNRQRLSDALSVEPMSLAVVHANDILPTTADGAMPLYPNSDLFYLTGIEQEETVLLLAPQAHEPTLREVLFVREPNERLRTWEGYKHSQEDAAAISGVQTVKWLADFPSVFRGLMCDAQHVYLNSNEHKRAAVEVETRDARFIRETQARYPLHRYQRLAPIMQRLRVVKSELEVELIRRAVEVTRGGMLRVMTLLRPGLAEYEVEAELAAEFIRHRGRFAFSPIIAAGANNCVLHYLANNRICQAGDLLLVDVGAAYANYNADLTRTLPVSGRFTSRQKQVYQSVLRVLRQAVANATVGKLYRDWQYEAQDLMNEELLRLKLITPEEMRDQTREKPACQKYFVHGLGHSLGLGVHDLGPMHEPFAPGWVLTVEPGIYIPAEGFGVRLENDILVTSSGPLDLSADVPIEADEIEEIMNRDRS